MALLKVAGAAKSTYFYHMSNMDVVNKVEERIKSQIISIFNENKGRYGYRRITLELKNRGFNVNHKKVQRIMKELGLQSIQRPKRRYNSYKGTIGKVADNLLKRDFKADKPNQKWATDVTEFKINNDKVFISNNRFI